MFYAIYKITNLLNNKVYVGKHKTDNIHDNYFGSGKLIKRAIKKYGKENFNKDILFVFDNEADMNSKEFEIVNEEFVSDPNTYNLMLGGSGGFDYINSIDFDRSDWQMAGAIARNKINAERMKCPIYRAAHCLKISKAVLNSPNKHKMLRDMSGENNPMYGKSHSMPTRLAMSKSRMGSGNNMYGKIWIYSLIEKKSKRVDASELGSHIDLGWHKGRKIKF